MVMEDKNSNIQVIDRTLDIIELLSTQQKGIGVTEISKKTNLHKTTVHRILSSLYARNYVEKNKNGEYKLGLKLIEIVGCHINELELQTEARPYLLELSSKYNLTSHLGVLDGENVVYIEKLETYTHMRLYTQIGYRAPAYCSSLGKCLLSSLSETELEDIMADCTFVRYTENTICDLKELKKHLRNIRIQKWAMDNQEQIMGQRCIAAPIYDYRGEVIAAVSGSGNLEQLPDEKINDVADYIVNIAIEISRRLGYKQ
ncbi:IclR family transcriptional regulator [Sedimentibacter saalensis]|jgi:DNA-binding IclR family transcriptional regulator|uniref:Glycerol operon regulatory protein n=1 Tax=Sedimentibacter saalensis TaxID=130788 RepID=A0A562JL82_9FIRM|nr:IclR family transcriptional regulator [Sedimentibacter saalensis]MEA5095544.1 IclR family transcriptional regulator [Sedimentibacter saalensis]TWH83723.1 IclR family transcriptional regulator [Sedimentibacter saalensis]